ncbi:MAG: hypothetical protein J2P21_21715 [Chloracidobacterium sp.]|nr:hypothetical protein [Chloracidobacterium sp.]
MKLNAYIAIAYWASAYFNFRRILEILLFDLPLSLAEYRHAGEKRYESSYLEYSLHKYALILTHRI